MATRAHTFSFLTGEYTVTLEDVYVLLRLPINGKAVNGKINFSNSICKDLLGADLLDDNPRGQGILLSRLKIYYNSLTLDENSIEKRKTIKPRCYSMLLIGSLLFSEGSGYMHVMYLPLFISKMHMTPTFPHTIAKTRKHHTIDETPRHHNNHILLNTTTIISTFLQRIVHTNVPLQSPRTHTNNHMNTSN